jgi:tetratricopeptide (TPR) repeat protein
VTGALRAEQLVELGRNREALSLLAPLLASEPDNPSLHVAAARAHLGLGEHDAALSSASEAVRLHLTSEQAHRLRAIALHRLDRHFQAVAAAEEAVRLAPNGWQAQHTLALAKVGMSWDSTVVRAAERAVELAPNEPSTHVIRGLVAQKRGETSVARAAYKRALALDPHHAMALNNLATLHRLRPGRQLRGYVAALRADPQLRISRDNVVKVTRHRLIRLCWVGLVGIALGAAASAVDGTGGTWFAAAVAVVLLGAVAGLLGDLTRTTHRGVRSFVVSRLRTDRGLLGWAVAALVFVGLALALCLTRVLGHPVSSSANLAIFYAAVVVNLTIGFARKR